MTETAAEPRLIDRVTIAREFRGGCQGLSFKLMTGEDPRIKHGWQRSTCLEQYDDLNPVGKLAIRLAPTGFGFFIAGLALQIPLQPPSGPVTIAVAYLVAMWAIATFYDPLMGLLELAGVAS